MATTRQRRAVIAAHRKSYEQQMAEAKAYAEKKKAEEAARKIEEEKKNASFLERYAHTWWDIGGNLATGAGKSLEGIIDLVVGGVGAVGGIFSEDFRQGAQDIIKYDVTGNLYGNAIERATKYSYLDDGSVGETVEMVAQGLGGMLPTVIAGIATGGVSAGAQAAATMATTAAGAAGQGAEEAYNDGAGYYEGLGYGAASGAVEAATEKLFGMKGMGKGVLDGAVKGVAAQGAKRVAKDALQEGAEEMLSEAVNPLLKTTYKGKEALGEYSDPEFYKRVGQAGLVGSLTGAAYGQTVGRAMTAVAGGNEDIDASREAIAELRKQQRNLQTNGKLTAEKYAEIQTGIKKNFQNIEKVLKKSSSEKREKWISGYGLEGTFDADGSLNAELATRLDYGASGGQTVNSEGKASQAQFSRFVDADMWNDRARLEEDLRKLNEDNPDGERIGIFDGELSENGERAYTDLRRAARRLNDISGSSFNVNVVNKNVGFNGVTVKGNNIYISADVLENGTWGETLTHEVTHFTEGTKEYESFRRFLMQDKELSRATLAELTAEGNAYGFTAADIESMTGKMERAAGKEKANTPKREFQSNIGTYSDEERNSIEAKKGNITARSYDDVLNFFKYSVSDKSNEGKTMFIGKILDNTAKKIYEATGINTFNKSIALNSHDLRHMMKKHGDADYEAMRNQEAITADNFEYVIETIAYPDEVTLEKDEKSGVLSLIFKKEIAGKTTAITVFSEKRKTLTLKTAWIIKKEQHISQSTNAKALIRTPEARSSMNTVPTDSIPDSEGNVNSNSEKNIQYSKKNTGNAEGEDGETFSDRERSLMEEYTALASEKLLGGDERFINRLVRSDRHLTEKIINRIRDTAEMFASLKTVEANRQYTRLKEAEKLFMSAVENAGMRYYNGKITVNEDEEDEGGELQYSKTTDNFEKRIDAWDGNTEGFSFVMGDAPQYLSQIEINGKKIGNKQVRIDATKIKRIMQDHHEMTKSVIKKLPNLLNDPILVLESKTVEGRLVLLGEVYANGKPVMMALELNPSTRSGNTTYVDVIKVASAYTRSNTQNLISKSNIRFVCENKSRVEDWLKVNRLQLPLPNSQSNSATNSIPDSKENVNSNSEKNIQYSIKHPKFSEDQIKNNIIDVSNMEAVKSIDENKLKRTGVRPSDIYTEFFASLGGNIYSDVFGDIALKRSSVKSEIRHGNTAEKIASIEAIPNVIEEGRVIHCKEKEAGVERIVVAAPIEIGQSPYLMGVMLQRDAQNQRLYLHNVVIKEEGTQSQGVDLLTTGTSEDNDRLFITSILQKVLSVKGETQKKRNAETLLMQNAHSNTSKTQVGHTSKDSISDSKKNVNSNSEKNIQYSKKTTAKIKVDMSETERAQILKDTVIRLHDIENVSNSEVDFEQLEKSDWKVVKKPLVNKLREMGYLKYYSANAIDIGFEFTGEGLRKSANSQALDYGGNMADLAKVVMNMQPLLDNAALIEIHSDKARKTAKANSRLLRTYVLLSAFREDEAITPVQFEIKEYVDNNNRLYLAVALTKIEASVKSDTALQEGERTRLLPTSDISIPQLIKKIKPKDKNFFKYLPNKFLTKAQLEAKHRALEAEASKYEKAKKTPGEAAKERANNLGDTVYNKKDAAAVADHIVLAINNSFGAGSKVLFGEDYCNKLTDVILRGLNTYTTHEAQSKFAKGIGIRVGNDVRREFADIENIKQKDIEVLEQTVADSIMTSFATDGKKSQFMYRIEKRYGSYERMHREIEQLRERIKLEGRLMNDTERLKHMESRRIRSASDYKVDSFDKAIKAISKIDFRGMLNVSGVRDVAANFREWYNKENKLFDYESEQKPGRYRQYISDVLDGIADGEGALNNAELAALDDVVKYVSTLVETWDKVFKNGKWVEAKDEATGYIGRMRTARSVQSGVLYKVLFKGAYFNEFADNAAVFRAADAYDEHGYFTEQYEAFRRAAIDAQNAELELREEIERIFKENKDYVKRLTTEMLDYNGTQMTVAQYISLYMTAKRRHSWAALCRSGFVIRDSNGDTVTFKALAEHPEEINTEEQMAPLIKELTEELRGRLSKTDIQYIEAMERAFARCADMKRATDMIRWGYTNISNGYYFPVRRYDIAKNVDDSLYVEVERASNMSFNKDTVKNANRLYIEPVNTVFERHISGVAMYSNFSIVVENLNRVLNVNTIDNTFVPETLRGELDKTKYLKEAQKALETLKNDIEGMKVTENDGMSKLVGKLRSGYAKSVLALNPKIFMTQLSSVFASTSMLEYGNIIKGMSVPGKLADVDKYCTLAHLRNTDKTAVRAQTLSDNVGKVSDVLLTPVGKIDRGVIAMLFGACQAQIASNGGPKIGTEQNKVDAGKLLERVILETQQNSIVTERSAAMRSNQEWKKFVTMFSADAVKVMGRVFDGIGECYALKRQLKLLEDNDNSTDLDRLYKEREALLSELNKNNVVDYVELDMESDIQKELTNATPEERGRIVERELKRQISQVGEYHFSDGTNAIMDNSDIRKIGHSKYETKNRASILLSDLINKSVLKNETDIVEHNKFIKFKYYQSKVKVGNDVYECVINVGYGKFDKKYHIYDINQFIIKKDASPILADPRKSVEHTVSRANIFNKSIHQNEKNVNSIAQKNIEERLEKIDKRIAELDINKKNYLKNRLKQAEKRAARSISALASSSVFMAMIALFFKYLYAKTKDKEPEEIVKDTVADMFGNMIGGLPIYRDIYSFVTDGFELDVFNMSVINDFLNAGIQGFGLLNEAMAGKEVTRQDVVATVRRMTFATGMLVGIPARNAYNLSSGLLNRFVPSAGYAFEDFFGAYHSYSSDLKDAIEKDDESMMSTITNLMIGESGTGYSEGAAEVMRLLLKDGYSVLPRSIGDTVTYNGVQVELDKKQRKKLKTVYGQADEAVNSLARLSAFRSADEEIQAKAISFVNELYYSMALAEVLGDGEKSKYALFASAIDVHKLALILATARSFEADKDRNGNAISGSKKKKIEEYIESQALSAAAKHMLMGALGYRNVNGEEKVRTYISTLDLTADEKLRLLGYSGYEVT